MKRRRISQVGIAGILAVISAVGLIGIVSLSNGALKQMNPTEQQQTLDAIVRTRLTQTAEIRQSATPEITEEIDPIWRTATEVKREVDIAGTQRALTLVTPGPPPTIDPLLPIFIVTAEPASTSENP